MDTSELKIKRAEVTLNYIKAFIWPILIGVMLLLFRGEIAGFLEGELEMDLFGVKIKGKRNSGLEEIKKLEVKLRDATDVLKEQLQNQEIVRVSLEKENEELRGKIEAQNKEIAKANAGRSGTPYKKAVVPKKDVLRAERSKELFSSIQRQVDVTREIQNKDKFAKAQRLEGTAFKYLTTGKYRNARDYFSRTDKEYPGYHNAAEITTLIRMNLRELEDSRREKKGILKVYEEILGKYSWGMPKEVQRVMVDYVRQNSRR